MCRMLGWSCALRRGGSRLVAAGHWVSGLRMPGAGSLSLREAAGDATFSVSRGLGRASQHRCLTVAFFDIETPVESKEM